jgi:predicted alpha/beta superfamily hydrolase
MKNILLFFTVLTFSGWIAGQPAAKGKVITQKFIASSIQNNRGGEDPMRQVSVYLPPGYDVSNERYPVIYFLHGYTATDTDVMNWMKFQELMDSGIHAHKFRPMIVVVPNSDTRFKGSFYSNSRLTGNWADFIGKDLVAWTDKTFRSIPDRKSRGLCGHSMGGYGTLKLAMLFPETFSTAYALSPAALGWYGDLTIQNPGFKRISQLKTEKAIIEGLGKAFQNNDFTAFYAAVFTSMARTFSPDETKLPLQADFPITYIGDSTVINRQIMQLWEGSFPLNMIEDHLPALKSLTALKFDWGRNEEFSHIPFTALQFSKKLESYGIPHFAEEYLGDHGNRLGGFAGRVYTEMLPFFDGYLQFKPSTTKLTADKKAKTTN